MNSIDRRQFLCSMAGILGIGLSTRTLHAASEEENEVSVNFNASGRLIAPDFLGFSYDTVGLTMDRILLPQNRSLISLVRRLGSNGVIRIGGNSSDRAAIRKGVSVSRTHVEHLAAFLSETGWRLIYGLNLGSGTPDQAAAEAEMVAKAVGPKLVAFQIGNEPDGYQSDLRPNDYNHGQYVGEWLVYSKAIRAKVPGAPLAGPDVGFDTSWLAPFAYALGKEVVFLTCHYYAEAQTGDPDSGIEGLLGWSERKLATTIQTAKGVTSEYGLHVRMAEINSVTGGGEAGVSDTLAAALWGIDAMFTLAEAGWLGVNFHGGGGHYSPIALTPNGSFEPKPLYYAMLLFAQAGRGSLLPLQLRALRPTLRVFAVRGTGGERRLIFVNKHLSQTERVRIATTGQKATILRLSAHSAASQSGLTLGGTSVGPAGDWTPRPMAPVLSQGNRFVIDLPAASATVIEILK